MSSIGKERVDNAKAILIQNPIVLLIWSFDVLSSVKNAERTAKQALGILLGASWEALEGCAEPLESSGRALGRLLGGSWEAFGRLLEASNRHLGLQTVRVRNFDRFLKKIGIFGGPCWRVFNIQNRIFEVPRGLPRRSWFLDGFLSNFGTIFGALRTSKIRFSYHRGAIFEDFKVVRWDAF